MSFITAHVLDASLGRPAEGVVVTLAAARGELDNAVTDADGRVTDLGPDRLPTGRYEVVFDTGDYFARRGQDTLYPDVTVHFVVVAGQEHYHIPLLLSPYAYTTYRGS